MEIEQVNYLVFYMRKLTQRFEVRHPRSHSQYVRSWIQVPLHSAACRQCAHMLVCMVSNEMLLKD